MLPIVVTDGEMEYMRNYFEGAQMHLRTKAKGQHAK